VIRTFKHPFEPQEIWDDSSFADFLTPEAAPPIARRHLCHGGKSGTSSGMQSSSTSAPGNVTAWATDAFNRASNAASQPFQSYTGEFVAPVNAQQTTGINNINDASGVYSGYAGPALDSLNSGLGAGQALTLAGAGPANPGALNINQYMSPYLNSVVASTLANLRQQQGQEQSSLAGNAIQSGAFGGDRAGVAGANLARQQDLATGQVASDLLNQGYNTALSTAQQQQGVGLSAQQANLARLLQAGGQFFNQGLSGAQGLSNLGTTQQTNELNAANAQIGAGTLQQQTQQQLDAALYNQFLQKQAYPFQTSQFLINALQGVAPVFGTTSTSYGSQTQPMPFFHSGGRVGLAAGGRSYDEADTYWQDKLDRIGLAGGGVSDDALARLYPWLAKPTSGPYGVDVTPHASMQLPQSPRGIEFHGPSQNQGLGSTIGDINKAVDFGKNLGDTYKFGKDALVGSKPVLDASGKVMKPATEGWFGYGGTWGASSPGASGASAPSGAGLGGALSVMTLDPSGNVSGAPSFDSSVMAPDLDPIYRRGGRVGLAYGGMPYANETPNPIVPEDIAEPAKITDPLNDMRNPAAQFGGGGGGGGSGLGSAINGLNNVFSLGKNIASAVPAVMSFLALANGGRVGKDVGGGATGDPVDLTGGPTTILREAQRHPNPDQWARNASSTSGYAPDQWVDPSDLFPKILAIESGNQHFQPNGQPVTSPKGAVGVAQVMPGTGPEAAKLAGVDWNPDLFNRGRTGDPVKDKEAEDYNRKLGQAYYNEQRRVFGDPMIAAAAYNAGPEAVRAAIAKAQAQGGSYTDYLPQETQGYVSSLMPKSTPSGDALSMVMTPPLVDPSASFPAKESWWDRESGGLSGTERAVLSVLSGLGGMASSPSRFLGSAILQGLGAGANTYAQLAQRGKSLDIAQQQANTAQGQLGIAQTAKDIQVLTQLRQIAAGYAANRQPVPAWIAQQINTLAARLPGAGTTIPRISAPSVVSVAPPSAPIKSEPLAPLPVKEEKGAPASASAETPKPEAQPAPTANITDPEFRRRLGPERDPTALRERAAAVAQFDPDRAKEFRDRAQHIEEQMLSTGKAIDSDGKVMDVPGWAEQQAAVGRVEPNQKWLDEQGTQALQRSQAREQLDVIRGILENYQSGSLAGMKAQAQALAKGLGIDVPNTATMNAADYEKFLKATLRNVFSDVKDMGGRPLVSEIQGFEKATASPELQPQANKEILAQLYARLNQLDKYYGDTASEMAKNKALDRGVYTSNWLKQKENGIAPMVEEAKRDLAVRGVSPGIGDMKEGHVYVIEAGQLPGVNAPTKYRFSHGPDGKPKLDKVP
jgi:hypothetical protein